MKREGLLTQCPKKETSNYKLVPTEPTPEMVKAAEDAYMSFGDMDLALRMAILAAPVVQGEQNQELVPTGKPDRITEQDVRDIATSYCHWKSVGFYNTWFSEKGRELLNKLNADREQVPTVAVPDEEVAKMFHESYEKLAPSFGYETREETRKEWEAVPPNNKALMIAVIKQIRLALLTPTHSQQSVDDLPGTWHESDLSGGWADSCNQDSKETGNDNQ